MQRRALGSFAWVVLGAGCVAKPALQGPLPVRNQHPAQLTVQHMDPASAAVLPVGQVGARLDGAYSSLFLGGGDPSQNSFDMDGETLRGAARARVGLGAGFEAGLELPFAHTSGGFLDSFVIGYHDTFGFQDQGRSLAAKDDFVIRARRDGADVWSVAPIAFEWLDVPLQLTYRLLEPGRDRLGATVRGGVELPVGDSARGYGNGLDRTLGVVLDWRPGDVGIYAHLQHTFAGTPARSRAAGFHFSDVTSAGVAVELPLTEDLHAFAQVEWETSTLRDLHVYVASRDQMLLWLGGRLATSQDTAIELGLGEDLIWRISPDFTFWLGFVWLPGMAKGTPPPSSP